MSRLRLKVPGRIRQAKERQEGTKGKSIPKQEQRCKDLETRETSMRKRKGGSGTRLVRGADVTENGLYPKDNEKPMEDFQLPFPIPI